MKRLLVVLSDSPLQPCGGLGIRFRYLLPLLARYFEVEVVCTGVKIDGDVGGVPVHSFCRDLTPRHDQLFSLVWLNHIAHTIQRPDILLAVDHYAARVGVPLAKLWGCKLVGEFDLAMFSFEKIVPPDAGTSPEMSEMAALIRESEQQLVEDADLILACSETYVRDIPWPLKRPAIAVPNGIDWEKWQARREPWKFAGGAKHNFVYIGRFNIQKGVAELLGTELPPDCALHFVGSDRGGDQGQRVYEATKQQDAVRFNPAVGFSVHHNPRHRIPWVDGEDKIRVMQSATAIVFPSKHEPFGIVGLEAFAAGTPLITTMVNGISEYADDETAIRCDPLLKVEPWTPEADIAAQRARAASITQAMYRVLKEDTRPMVARARERAKAFTWERAGDVMLRALASL